MNAPEKLTVRIKLPSASGKLEEFRLSAPRDFGMAGRKAFNRVAFAAAHVVSDPLALENPWLDAAVDWEATIAYRRYLWSLGLGVAEAMDTAQRGMGLDWPSSLELIKKTLDAARDVPGAFVASGAGTDHLSSHKEFSVQEIISAYEAQCASIEKLGGRIILMASRALAACAKSPEDYARVYERILSQVKEPVIIHWLGEMFDPALAGYWGSSDHDVAMATALEVRHHHSVRRDHETDHVGDRTHRAGRGAEAFRAGRDLARSGIAFVVIRGRKTHRGEIRVCEHPSRHRS